MDERRLSFGEHLEELRRHVIRAVIYIALASVVALLFQDQLLAVVLWPQRRVALTSDREERLAKAAEELQGVFAEVAKRPLLERPIEEQRALGRRFGIAFQRITAGPDPRVAFNTPTEPFMSYLKVAFICALFLASPFFAYELWQFVAEGLRDTERRWVRIFGPLTFGCFAAGVLFGYFILIPMSLEYLETYGSPDLVFSMITLDGYLDLFLGLTMAVGLVFEVPIVLVFLALIGVVTAQMLAEFRRYFILIATIVAAVITPTGDPLTLSIVALPLIVLYEIGILSVRLIERRTPTT